MWNVKYFSPLWSLLRGTGHWTIGRISSWNNCIDINAVATTGCIIINEIQRWFIFVLVSSTLQLSSFKNRISNGECPQWNRSRPQSKNAPSSSRLANIGSIQVSSRSNWLAATLLFSSTHQNRPCKHSPTWLIGYASIRECFCCDANLTQIDRCSRSDEISDRTFKLVLFNKLTSVIIAASHKYQTILVEGHTRASIHVTRTQALVNYSWSLESQRVCVANHCNAWGRERPETPLKMAKEEGHVTQ